jgi:hypothetical protein
MEAKMALKTIPFVASSTEDKSFSSNIRDTIFEEEDTAFNFSFKQYSNVNNSYVQYSELLAVEGGVCFPNRLSQTRF